MNKSDQYDNMVNVLKYFYKPFPILFTETVFFPGLGGPGRVSSNCSKEKK